MHTGICIVLSLKILLLCFAFLMTKNTLKYVAFFFLRLSFKCFQDALENLKYLIIVLDQYKDKKLLAVSPKHLSNDLLYLKSLGVGGKEGQKHRKVRLVN